MREGQKYAVVRVSQPAHEAIKDFEQAVFKLAAADSHSPTDVTDAYSALCQRRLDLYTHIQKLERDQRVAQPVRLRFL